MGKINKKIRWAKRENPQLRFIQFALQADELGIYLYTAVSRLHSGDTLEPYLPTIIAQVYLIVYGVAYKGD